MMTDPTKCIILTPVSGAMEWATELAIFELMKRGYASHMMYGCANVDIARSRLSSDILSQTDFEEIFWVDSDIAFNVEDFERLRSHDLPIVCGLYPKKLKEGGLAAILEESTDRLVFGEAGGLLPIRWAGTGFLYTKRCVYEDIKTKLDLPRCKMDATAYCWPFFMPFTIPVGDGSDDHIYLGDDTSFCERARMCGYKIYADTTIRLEHIGKYRYSWEDIAGTRERVPVLSCNITRKPVEASVNGN